MIIQRRFQNGTVFAETGYGDPRLIILSKCSETKLTVSSLGTEERPQHGQVASPIEDFLFWCMFHGECDPYGLYH